MIGTCGLGPPQALSLRSRKMPPPPRIAVLPSPNGSQAKPNRGPNRSAGVSIREPGYDLFNAGITIPLAGSPEFGAIAPIAAIGYTAPLTGSRPTFFPPTTAGCTSFTAFAGSQKGGAKV